MGLMTSSSFKSGVLDQGRLRARYGKHGLCLNHRSALAAIVLCEFLPIVHHESSVKLMDTTSDQNDNVSDDLIYYAVLFTA